MNDALDRLVVAMPSWMNPTAENHGGHALVIAELLVNLRILPSGEAELTVGHPLPRDSDTVLRLTGSVDEFVELARKLDALFTPTASAT